MLAGGESTSFSGEAGSRRPVPPTGGAPSSAPLISASRGGLHTHRRSAPRRAGPSSGRSDLEEGDRNSAGLRAGRRRLLSPSPGLTVSTSTPIVLPPAPSSRLPLNASGSWRQGRPEAEGGRAWRWWSSGGTAPTHRGNLPEPVCHVIFLHLNFSLN